MLMLPVQYILWLIFPPDRKSKVPAISAMAVFIFLSIFSFLFFTQSSSLGSSSQIFLLLLCGALNCAPDAILGQSELRRAFLAV
jgi:hypothetical protein